MLINDKNLRKQIREPQRFPVYLKEEIYKKHADYYYSRKKILDRVLLEYI